MKEDMSFMKKACKVLHKITSVIMYAIFYSMLVIGAILIIYLVDIKIRAARGITDPPKFNAYVIVSPSMVPNIKVNDAVIVKKTPIEKIKFNDVITFTSGDKRFNGMTVTHRVVGITKNNAGEVLFRTKGDNNNTADSALVKEDQIHGKVILTIPKLGYIQYFLSQSYGWIIIIVMPCLGIVIYDIMKIFKNVNNNMKNKSKEKME